MRRAFTEEETVQFDHNGSMVDSSRNCVMSVEAVKAWIRMQASVGMNTLMLYTEDTYEVPGYPYFGALRGRYTAEELKEMDALRCRARCGADSMYPVTGTSAAAASLGRYERAARYERYRMCRVMRKCMLLSVPAFIRSHSAFPRERYILEWTRHGALGLGRYLLKNGYTPKREIIRQHMAPGHGYSAGKKDWSR